MNDQSATPLGIYLNDHLAALVAGRELARRTSSGASDIETQTLAREFASRIVESERELERLLGEIGARRSRVKRLLASAAEKSGRLKLNGHLVTRSPLSDLVELEGLIVLLEYEIALWRSLNHTRPGLARSDSDFADREQQAREWRDRLVSHSRDAARRSFH
jgi:hypothetical protein